MKIIILTFFASLVIVSCSSNNSNVSDDSLSSSIISKWHLKSIHRNGITNVGTLYTCNTNFDITEYTGNGQFIIKYSSNDVACTQLIDLGTYTYVDNIIDEVQKNGNVIVWERKGIVTEHTPTTLKVSIINKLETGPSGNVYNSSYSLGELVYSYEKIN